MMNRIGSLTVGELLTQPVILGASDPVSKAIGLLQRSNAYEVFITEKDEVRGVVTIRDILNVSNITSAKMSTLMSRVPQLATDHTISRAAKIMTDQRVRALPVVQKGKLVGQLTASSICDQMARQRKLNLTAAAAMTGDPVFLREDDLVAKARTVMIQRNIDHLPVLRQKDITGMVTSDAIVFRTASPERIARESIVAEEQRRFDVKASALMARDPVICTPDIDVSQVIQEMSKRRTAYSLVGLWGELEGIITYRDCVKLLAEPPKEALPISIVGLPQDPFEAEAARAKFERVVKRLAKSLPDLLEARSVIKTSERTGNRRRYEVVVDLFTSREEMSFSSSGWSLPEVFDVLQDKMKRVTTKKAGQRKERRVTAERD